MSQPSGGAMELAPDGSWMAAAAWMVLGCAHQVEWHVRQGVTAAAIAEREGVAESTVEWWLSIARLPPPALPGERAGRGS